MTAQNQTITESYIGAGILYVNGRDVGNVSELKFSIDQEEKSQKNYRGGGGNVASVTRITGVSLEGKFHSFNNENLALALRGVVENLDTESITDEPVSAVVGGLTATAHMIDTSKPVTVKNGDVTVAVEKYDVTPAGIKLRADSGVTDDTALKISYNTRQRSVLQAAVNSGAEWSVVFDGVNEAESGKPCVIKVYRWKPSPTDGLDLISDDFGEFTIKGQALADVTRPVGKSQFFTREYAK
nr:hypothetical protein [Plesiomonas shigelloides]